MPYESQDEDWVTTLERATDILEDPGIERVTSDRRYLWDMHSRLIGVNMFGPTQMFKFKEALREYLHSTCRHVWSEYIPGPDDVILRHRQCYWCNLVEWWED